MRGFFVLKMAQAPRDQNRIPTLLGVDDIAFTTPTTVAVDATTHAMLVEASFSPSGTQDVNITKVGGTAIALGQTTMSASLPVTLASDQASIPVTVSGVSTLAEQQTQTTALGTLLTTSAFNAVFGTAGSADSQVLTIQGVAGMQYIRSGGEIANDSADSGNPLKIGTIAYSPDGTTPGTAVTELDRTNAKGDLDGRIYINTIHPRHGNFHSDGSSALTDTSVVADPGDGFQVVLTGIFFSTGAATACNIFFEEGSTKILGPWYLEAVAGRGLQWKGEKFVTASTAVTVTTSAAIAQSLDVDYYIQAV